MTVTRIIAGAVVALVMAPAGAVNGRDATRLDGELTPIGAQRAANGPGTIPAWEGGLLQPPTAFPGPGSRYVDPFPQDRPLFIITAANLSQHRAHLTAGQLALFERYPDSYKMPVYRTRRSGAFPDWIYEETRRNVARASLSANGESVRGTRDGIPFPIPTNGLEVMWNHRLRYQGEDIARWNVQAAVGRSGSYTLSMLHEEVRFLFHRRGRFAGVDPNIFAYYRQRTAAPPRNAGQLLLVHETIDQLSEPRRAWVYNPGQRRVRRAPHVAYDNPGIGADGLRTTDQTDSFNGALDRYSWKLVGKREVYIGSNAYRIHSSKLRYKDLLRPNHINQDHARYELRRVWVVDAELRPGASHIYGRRTFYIDEDSWQIHLVDVYDRRGELWRVQDAHGIMAYDRRHPFQAIEVIYDLHAQRYLAQAMSNEEPERTEAEFPTTYFSSSALARGMETAMQSETEGRRTAAQRSPRSQPGA